MPKELRYEFYLPTFYNNKEEIEKIKYLHIKNKIRDKFGGISIHPGKIEGQWFNKDDGEICYDYLVRFEVCVDGSITNQLFFEDLKEELKKLFDQKEIYMVCTEINRI